MPPEAYDFEAEALANILSPASTPIVATLIAGPASE